MPQAIKKWGKQKTSRGTAAQPWGDIAHIQGVIARTWGIITRTWGNISHVWGSVAQSRGNNALAWESMIPAGRWWVQPVENLIQPTG